MAVTEEETDLAKPTKQAKPSFDQVKKQFLLAFIGNLLAFGQGANMGWYSPALPMINTVPSPLLDGPISQDRAGWVGSFLSIGCVCGGLGFGLLANWIGYKRSMLLAAFPVTTSWGFILFGNYSWQILVSRFLSGMSAGAAFTCFPQFVAEIATDSIRGQLNSYIQIACYSGILVGFVGGSYLPYHVNPIVMLSIPFMFFLGFMAMPESPQFLLKMNRTEDAEKSLRYYRNVKTTDDVRSNELIYNEFEKFKAIAKQNEEQPPLTIGDFLNPVALRAILICPFLLAVNQLSGAFAISSYAETIFKDTGSTVDPQMSSIVMAATQVVGTYTASQLMDNVGRKVLLLVSLSGGIVSLLITGTYSYLAKHDYDVSDFNWVPVVSISSFIFICSIGMLPAPYVMLAEVIPQRIRRVASTFCTSIAFICQATMLRLLPMLLDSIQLYGCMWLFASISTVGLLFTIFVVKETKGINLDVYEQKDQNK